MEAVLICSQNPTDILSAEDFSFADHVKKIWEDRNQFEEAVQILLSEHQQNKPRAVFY